MKLAAGVRLGPYEIVAPIGAGGMGEVYRARDTRLGREVAIKVLPPDLTRDTQRIARFEREARSSSALNHRNIVTIHDFGSQDGETWLVMEWIRGEMLRDIIARGPVPMKKLLTIGAEIADGLAAAHAAGIIHRDLKPENVMVTSDGTAKILDFGLVKQTGITDPTNSPTEMRVTQSGVILGTADYMSPEQARGEEVDFRTDHFSLGVILYEMATGKHPFRRATTAETMVAILKDDPPPLHETFDWIVERCLTKNPADRYGSTADLAHDLRRLIGGQAPRPLRSDRSVVAARIWWPIIAAVAAIAIVVAVMLTMRPKDGLGPMEVALAAPGIEQVTFGETAAPVTISPDGRFVVISAVGSNGIDSLWLEDLRSRGMRPIAGSEYPYGVAWSPDSRSIAYCAAGKLKTNSVDGGPARVICDALPPGTPTWSGDAIFFADLSGIFRVNAGGGTPQAIVRIDPAHPRDIRTWPQILPDGKHFLYIALNRRNEEVEHELLAGTLDGGPPKRVAAIDSRALFSNGYLLFVRDGTLLAQAFDAKALQLTGEPQPLTDDIHYFRTPAFAAFSTSKNGLLAWRSARRPSRQVWLDRAGIEVGSIGSGVFSGGRLSPDGRRYAAGLMDTKQGSADIWIYDLSRQNAERLTFRLTEENNPVWSADGQTLYYRCDVFGPPDIFRWKLGEDHGTFLYGGPAIDQPEDVSPDGKWLLFISYNRTAGSRIMALPLDRPGQPRLFSPTPFNELSPRFSPDGKLVAYQSDLSGRPEVYVRPFEGSSPAMLLSKDGGTRPRWRHDGKELFFLAPGGRLMAVSMEGGTPHQLFRAGEAIDFEPAPDGSRFLVQLEERSTDPALHLLINWPARLRAEK